MFLIFLVFPSSFCLCTEEQSTIVLSYDVKGDTNSCYVDILICHGLLVNVTFTYPIVAMAEKLFFTKGLAGDITYKLTITLLLRCPNNFLYKLDLMNDCPKIT